MNSPQKTALLVDSSFAYRISRQLGSKPDYGVILDDLCVDLAVTPEDLAVYFWTSAPLGASDSFSAFLKYLEDELRFKVFTTVGDESYVADVRDDIPAESLSVVVPKLQRHDAFLTYLIGSMALTHRLVALSDAFAVAWALESAGKRRGGVNYLAAPRSFLPQIVLNHVREENLRLLDFEHRLGRLFSKKPVSPRKGSRLTVDFDD